MADSTISQLPVALTVNPVDFFAVDQGGVTKRATLGMLGNGTVYIAAGKIFTVSNTLTLAGTDGTTMTFPATNASLARIDAAQSFTGLQTFTDGITTPAQVTSTVATGTPPLVVASTTPVTNLSIGGNSATVTTNANLTGEVTSVGNATTVLNATVISKVLTGFVSGAGVVAATDTILQGIDKLDGNVAARALLAGSTAQPFSVSTLNGAPPAHKCHVINPNFQIAQAGTSFAAPASNSFDLDGWMNQNTSAAVFTVTQATGSSAAKLARIVTITTADAAVAAGDLIVDKTKIEGYDIVDLVGQTFTVSFWAKYPITGIHCISLRNSIGDRSYVHEITVTSANTWSQYSFTVIGGLPTAGTWAYTNTAGLLLDFAHMTGSTFQTTADTWNTGNFLATANQVNDAATIGNVWGLQDVRIDLGTVVGSDWPSYQEALAWAQRYAFNPLNYIAGIHSNTNNFSGTMRFLVPMRTTPTINVASLGTYHNVNSPPTAGTWGFYEANSGNYVTYATPPTTIAIAQENSMQAFMYSVGTTPSLNTQGYEYLYWFNGVFILFEARL